MVSILENCVFSDRLTILEQDAGLHFLLKIDTGYTDRELIQRFSEAGIRIRALSEYYHDTRRDLHCLVVNYSGLKPEALTEALERLTKIM